MDDRLRALVVEDDPATRRMLVQVLEDEGFDTFGAHDGAHAVRTASAGQPDVIVLDIGLPVLDATGFVERWRTREGASGVPIIGISGLPHGEAMARELGAAAFFDKPIELDALVASARAFATAYRRRTAEKST